MIDKELKEDVTTILRKFGDSGVSVHEIRYALRNTRPSRKQIRKLLHKMAKNNEVVQLESDYYAIGEALKPVRGVLRFIEDVFWVVPDRKEKLAVKIPISDLHIAIAGDSVVAELTSDDGKGHRKGKILSVVKSRGVFRKGVARKTRGGWAIWLNSGEEPVFIEQKEAPRKLKPGDKVRVKIDHRIWRKKQRGFPQQVLTGQIMEISFELGRKDDPRKVFAKIDANERNASRLLDQLAAGMSIDLPFSQRAMNEAKDALVENLQSETYGTDLTKLPFVTIDPDDAKDFDDAVFAESLSDNKIRLWVAIADVSSYVLPDSALDREALDRGFSVYMPGRVYPMLPKSLSENVCSLKPNVIRRVMWVNIDFDHKGVPVRYDVGYGTIRSQKRLTYDQAQAHIDQVNINQVNIDQVNIDQVNIDQVNIDGNTPVSGPIASSIDLLVRLSKILRKKRKRRGMIDLDLPAPKIGLNKDGSNVAFVIPQPRNTAHRMIEESMLAANEAIADLLAKENLPALYRTHSKPAADRLVGLHHVVKLLQLNVKLSSIPKVKELNHVLSFLTGQPKAQILSSLVLRALPRAKYSPTPDIHYGIGAKRYLHFTSPIRRYPDLLVHRGLRAWIDKEKTKKNNKLLEIATRINAAEKIADKASRFADRILSARLMLDNIGKHYQGTISGVSSFGLFVTLLKPYVEGMIPIRSLGNEFFDYIPEKERLLGIASGTSFSLGDEIDVQCVDVNLKDARILFQL